MKDLKNSISHKLRVSDNQFNETVGCLTPISGIKIKKMRYEDK